MYRILIGRIKVVQDLRIDFRQIQLINTWWKIFVLFFLLESQIDNLFSVSAFFVSLTSVLLIILVLHELFKQFVVFVKEFVVDLDLFWFVAFAFVVFYFSLVCLEPFQEHFVRSCACTSSSGKGFLKSSVLILESIDLNHQIS